MSHTLEQMRNKKPMWFFEYNYIYLRELFPEIIELYSETLVYRDSLKLVKIKCQEVSRYTTLISLNLDFIKCPQIPSVEMSIRLYHDAEVADVVTYQNISRLVAPYFSTEKDTDQDHKRQANILLYELLSGCMKKRSLETV
ncbi:MAG: DUF1249 domain-containing protein [Gammaproteobacteria bacterium]|nr:DUF1249 domain-containing protein [Gammaproteobacteria bacterium]